VPHVSGDPRVEQYAKLLVEDCVDVQSGWQVIVNSQPTGRPLVEEVCRQIALRGAYALPRIGFSSALARSSEAWVKEAPEELLQKIAPIEAYALENCDCNIIIMAPENTRDGSDIPRERFAQLSAAARPYAEPFFRDEKPWVGCQWPTPALAQDAGMTLEQFTDFLYGAVLIDWPALEREMEKIAERFDGAKEIRVVGDGTDLTFSLEGRSGKVSGAGANMPSGEVFYSPVEDSANGVVTFSEYPAYYQGQDVHAARLRFENGRAVEITARSNEDFFKSVLATDDGASVLGEFGIGCNPGIQQHMRNTLFDEKIEGTIHLAMGNGFPFIGGTNESAVHWDMVKDLRQEGELYVDGELVQKAGAWRF
jgi:aminopeptidase